MRKSDRVPDISVCSVILSYPYQTVLYDPRTSYSYPGMGYYAFVEIPGGVQWVLYMIPYPKSSVSSLLVIYPIRQVLWDFCNPFAIGFQVLYWIYYAEIGSRSRYFCVFCNTFVPLFEGSVGSTNFVPVPWYELLCFCRNTRGSPVSTVHHTLPEIIYEFSIRFIPYPTSSVWYF